MVRKELKLNTLRSIKLMDLPNPVDAEIVRPVLKLKHYQRFQTKVSKEFEKLLSDPNLSML